MAPSTAIDIVDKSAIQSSLDAPYNNEKDEVVLLGQQEVSLNAKDDVKAEVTEFPDIRPAPWMQSRVQSIHELFTKKTARRCKSVLWKF